LAFFTLLSKNEISSPIIYLGVGLMCGTLGLALAVMLALLISTGSVKHLFASLVLAIFVIMVSFIFPDLGSATRIKPVLDSIALLASGKIDLETVTYGQLVQILNTTDLSFLFRLKHWLNIINIFINGNATEWFFGFGAGASVLLSTTHLVPHNDYLRMLFEFGMIAFFGFIVFIISIVISIGRGWQLVPFLSICIYFFTENLINNYIAMILFFFSAGAIASNKSASTNIQYVTK
jgi:hypothetical protein